MRKFTYFKTMLLALILLVGSGNSWGQASISAGGTYNQDFNLIGTSATATLPTGWKASSTTTLRSPGAYTAAGTATTQSGAASIATNATGGIYNFGNSTTSTDRAVGGLSGGSTNKNQYIYVDLLNNGASSISSFSISYKVEKYRDGTNPTGFSIQMFYSTDGSSWTSAGTDFLTSFAGSDATNGGYVTTPGTTQSVTSKILTQTIAASSHLYLCWNYCVTSGTTITNAQGLGIDDVSITANTATSATPPILTADATNNDVDNNIDITFTDDATWRTTPGIAVKVGGTALTATTDYVLTAGNLQLKPSGGNSLLTTAGSKSVTIEAAGYNTASVTQLINVGAPAKLGMKTQPAAPSANGGTLATQPAVYIQDQYGNTTTSTVDVTAVVGTGTWTLGGTLTVAAVAGTATFSGLTATSATAVTGATIGFTSDLLTATTSGTFDIPVPVPTITASTATLSGFTYAQGSGPSTEKTFTVSGLNLTHDISIVPSTDYEISTGTGASFVVTNPITLTQSGGTVANTPIYVRLKADLTTGTYNSENINITSTDATPQTVACSGSVTAPPTTLPFVENFDYPNGALLTSNGWSAHSGAGTQAIDVIVPGLSFNGYIGSGIGGAARVDNTGEDVNKTFTPQTSGSIYAAFIISASSTNSSGYFFHLAQADIAGTSFVGRVWINATGTSVGIGTAASVAISANTPTLLVVKYNIDTKLSSLYVLNTMSATEPTVAAATYPETATLTNIGAVCLRQYSASQNILVDGITVTTSWSDLLIKFSGTGDWTNTSRWNTGVVPDATANVVVDGDATISANTVLDGITINSGKSLTVNAGKQLTVSTALTNNGTLNLLSDGTNGTATLLTPGTVTTGTGATYNVNQYLPLPRRTWYMSSPVASVSPAGSFVIRSYDEPSNTWGSATLPMVYGIGYSVTPPADGTNNILFTGALNTGEQSITLSRQGSTSQAGFNAVGNPYPSFIDWKAMVTKNTAILETGTMWYRSKETGSFKFYTVDASGVVSPSGSTATAFIPPMQAFWVKTSTNASTLYFEDNMRSHAAGTNPLKAPAAKNIEFPLLRLQVSNGINSDEAVIYSYSGATNGYDFYDSPKMMNNDATIPEIYTTLNNQPIVINVMNSLPLNTEIGLEFVPGNATSFSIRANEISNLPSDVKVILKDNANNGTETDLTDGVTTYTFSPATITGNRFSLIFRSAGSVSGIENPDNLKMLVYSNAKNQLTVIYNDALNDASTISVYNAVGQKLISRRMTGTSTVLNGTFTPGVYVVKVNNVIRKIIVE